MPQTTLLPNLVPAMEDLQIRVRPPLPGVRDLEVTIYVSLKKGALPMPVWVGSLPGVESDYLTTLCSEVVAAWAFGERLRDVQIAAAGVKKAARAHRYAHEV